MITFILGFVLGGFVGMILIAIFIGGNEDEQRNNIQRNAKNTGIFGK